MASPSDPRLAVTHALRLKGFADLDAVATAAGLDAEIVRPELAALEEAGHAKFRDGRMTGWMLTPEGRANGERLLAAELDERGTRALVESAYERFLALNQPMLALCTDWQMRTVDGEQVVNDHSDAEHDTAVIAGLGAVDEQIQPICAELAAALERFDGYGARFADARRKVAAGEIDWFTKPMIDSYHTVWFELHENLLATLGLDRVTEGST